MPCLEHVFGYNDDVSEDTTGDVRQPETVSTTAICPSCSRPNVVDLPADRSTEVQAETTCQGCGKGLVIQRGVTARSVVVREKIGG